MATTIFGALGGVVPTTYGTPIPGLIPRPASGGGGGGGGDRDSSPEPSLVEATAAPPPSKKAMTVGVVDDFGTLVVDRVYARFKISDLPTTVFGARLEWLYLDKAQPTASVHLLEIADPGTLDSTDWEATIRATVTTTFLTPASNPNEKVSADVLARYSQAKLEGKTHLAFELRYATESETGSRWYRVGLTGDWAPVLVLAVTAGQDQAFSLLATRVAVNLARADDRGTPAAVIEAGDGATYPPLGEQVQLAAAISGLKDDGSGTYTGTPSAPIQRADILRFLYRSPDEGCGMTAGQVDGAAFDLARIRLAGWFDLAGGLTEATDIRTLAPRIARSLRGVVYLDQDGRESLWIEPDGSAGTAPVRAIGPAEHGALRAGPLVGPDGALAPVSRVEVLYGLDRLGLAASPWQGRAILAAGDSSPADADREAQAVDAEARYGVREPEGMPTAFAGDAGYEWVSLDAPGVPTGVRIRNWEWDRTRVVLAAGLQLVSVELPRFALGFRLFDEVTLESAHFPSAARRRLLAGGTYAARRARLRVREIPRLLPESGPEFPVQIAATLVAWDTP